MPPDENVGVRPVVSVIVVAWRSAPHLMDCLESLAASETEVPYELVVVLNEPEDALCELARREFAGVTVVRTRVNVGYGGAVNLGVSRSTGEFVALLNDDAVVEPGWLGPLVETMRRRPRAGAVGSTTLFPDGTLQEAGSVIWSDGTTVKAGRGLPGSSPKYRYERRVDFCSGTSLLVRRSSFERAGGLEFERYFPAYYEDTELCLRLAALGEEVWYQPMSRVRHLESASTNFFYRDFLMARNRRVFCARWAALLSERSDPGDRSVHDVDLGVHLAMGAPRKILVLAEPSSAKFVASLAGDGCHFVFAAEARMEDLPLLSRQGVRVLGEDPARAVREEFPPFDAVLDLRTQREDPDQVASRLGLSVLTPEGGLDGGAFRIVGPKDAAPVGFARTGALGELLDTPPGGHKGVR